MMGTTFLKVSAEVNSKIIEPKIDPTAVIAEILTHSGTFFFSSCRYDSTALYGCDISFLPVLSTAECLLCTAALHGHRYLPAHADCAMR